MNTIEDQKILEGIKTGDEVVITAFYKKNMPYIRRYVLQNSGSELDVEDVFQDAMVLIYQKLKVEQIELYASLQTYFYGICKNIWRNRLRKNNKMVSAEDLLEAVEALDPDIVEEIERNEEAHVYRKHFVNLSEACQKVLNMVFNGKSMRQIAESTGYTEGYARKKKFECKEHLIEMIEKDPLYKELKEPIEKN
ncbi:sigma-70 family RNA polymerase sigma factor [Aquimarina sp. 2201CG1-2-11]|uniref:RNA polymerase sigma factor n=1 Tax=Aquimarina discodermiae TaxID=3231043 RepID=UPI003461A933